MLFSRRTYSLFVLRLFNDAVSALVCQLTIHLIVAERLYLSCFFFSIAVSVKMNALLYVPGILFLLRSKQSLRTCLKLVLFATALQLALAMPFLLTNAHAYLHRSFEVTRKFDQLWSLNYQFLPASFFSSHAFSILLLLASALFYLLFWFRVWRRDQQNAVMILTTSNFIGVVFARSIHYQFYSWYSTSLPALLHHTSCGYLTKCLIFFTIELSYNFSRPSPLSSFLWLFSHHFLLYKLFLKGSVHKS